ncbi:MAG: hypothetical protein HQK54_02225 [Oligoflexales bacterium]|nr:hypothetical protein [Oligoflexales bacterium]
MPEIYISADSIEYNLSQSVRAMYEAFPYPCYPLLMKPKWQEGYIGSSSLITRLSDQNTSSQESIIAGKNQIIPHRGKNILVAGCGEAQPYILRKLEPGSNIMYFLDFSTISIIRSRLRLILDFKKSKFLNLDLNEFLKEYKGQSFHHIDCYGVLHHLPTPSRTIELLKNVLHPAGTMRIMIYNKRSRSWIHNIERAFSLLKLDPYDSKDLLLARKVLDQCEKHSESLSTRLKCIGIDNLKIDSRLVDTFFHRREARIEISRWLEIFDNAGLVPFALFDRYAELDDLPNPLWKMPSAEQLTIRSNSGIFENNLELFVRHKSHPSANFENKDQKKIKLMMHEYFHCLKSHLVSPPSRWFSYDETKTIPLHHKYCLWHRHLNFLFKNEDYEIGRKTIDGVPFQALCRLARIGAIFKKQIPDKSLADELSGPMTSNLSYEKKDFLPVNFENTSLSDLISTILTKKGKYSAQRKNQILFRLKRAQD